LAAGAIGYSRLTARCGKKGRIVDLRLANAEALRQRIKRARDSMRASVGLLPIQKNSITKPQAMEGSYFIRSGGNRQGGSGGRR